MRLRLLLKCVTGVCIAGVCAAAVSSMPVASAAPRTSSAGGGHFSFALIGDMPYGPEGDAKFPNTLAEINADRTLSFVVHDAESNAALRDDLRALVGDNAIMLCTARPA